MSIRMDRIKGITEASVHKEEKKSEPFCILGRKYIYLCNLTINICVLYVSPSQNK